MKYTFEGVFFINIKLKFYLYSNIFYLEWKSNEYGILY